MKNSMNNAHKTSILIFSIALLVGCQAVEKRMNREFGLFHNQGDELEDLVSAGRYEAANNLLKREHGYFLERKLSGRSGYERYAEEIQKIAKHVNADIKPKIEQQILALEGLHPETAEQKDWRRIQFVLRDARFYYSNYQENTFLRDKSLYLADVDRLKESIDRVAKVLKKKSSYAFVDFLKNEENSLGADFFLVYPVDLNAGKVLADSEDQVLSYIGDTDIEGFLRTYGRYLPYGSSLKDKLSTRVLATYAKQEEHSGQSKLARYLELKRKADLLDVRLGDEHQLQVSFVDVTGPENRRGQAIFSLGINIDLDYVEKKPDFERLAADVGGEDYVVLLDVVSSDLHRNADKRIKKSSKRVAGYETAPNKAYTAAQLLYNKAQRKLQEAQQKYCPNGAMYYICFNNLQTEINKWETQLSIAEAALLKTPETIQSVVYETYEYVVAPITIKKQINVNFYVIDIEKNSFVKDSIALEDSRSFRLSYGIDEQDPNGSALKEKHNREDELVAFEGRDMEMRLSEIVDRYIESHAEERRLRSIYALMTEIEQGHKQNAKKLKKSKEEPASVLAKTDGRFGSVVLIKTGDGLGAGFYVEKNLLVTNHHVVDGVEYVEVKKKSGEEGLGKVLRSDERLDLALIQTGLEGDPVSFYDGEVRVGTTVEAIGHPERFEFSLTKGIVSAVRKVDRSGLGLEPVLYVQTDAPINPGNSGGPLFVGDSVLGVNDWKLGDSEGLGFAIYHTEVQEFLGMR